MKRHFFALCFLYTLTNTLLWTQTLPLEGLTIDDGLTQGMIFDILQDKDGFLWIGTKDGLNRYDGYHFKTFEHTPNDSFSLSGQVVFKIFEDSRGWLWVSCEHEGLNIYDKNKARFYHLTTVEGDASTLQSNDTNYFEEDKEGNIWVANSNGIDKVVIPSGFSFDKAQSASLNKQWKIERVIEKTGDTFFIMFKKDTLFWSENTGMYWKILTDPRKTGTYYSVIDANNPNPYRRVHSVYEDANGAQWFGRTHYYSRKYKGKMEHFFLPLLESSPKISITPDLEGRTLIGYSRLERISSFPNGAFVSDTIAYFPDFSASKIYVDKTGLIWIGTNGFGLRKYNPRTRDFNRSNQKMSTRQIYEDRQGRLWVWANYQFNWYDKHTGKLMPIRGFTKEAEQGRYMLQDARGIYWFNFPIEQDGVKIIRFNPATGEQKFFPYDKTTDSLTPMLNDKDGNIWMGSYEPFLIKFDTKKEQFSYLNIEMFVPPKTRTNLVKTLYQDDQGILWVGTPFGLIRIADPNSPNPQMTILKSEPNAPNSLTENHVLSIYQSSDDPNIFWIGTKGGGLNRYDRRKHQFTHFTTADGLPNNVVYGILSDDIGDLWLSTNRGLSCFNIPKKTFKNYFASDGLQDSEFNTGSYYRGHDGLLYFGGIKGINYFDPKKVRSNTSVPMVYITQIKINNQIENYKNSSILQAPIELTSKIRLKYFQNTISFEFAALDFTTPQKNQYQYQMRGVDHEWVDAGNRHEVTYTHLQPGKYTFRVKGANSSGTWNDKPCEIVITVLPPWWRTTWAYLLYVLLIGGAMWQGYRFQINRIRLKNQLLFEHKETQRLAELDKIKSNFFSNITHEFRTPLTLILEPIRRIIQRTGEEELLENAHIAEKNSQKLLELVNQLLDLSKLEGKAMKIEWSTGDPLAVLEVCHHSFLPLAEKKGINLQFDDAGEHYMVQFDKDKLEKIITNLLSNAIKFTPRGGQVVVQCHYLPPKANNGNPNSRVLHISVADTGPGIPAENLQAIFDRFFQVNSDGQGTGIGLALSKELAELLGGDIVVKSQPGQGTTFEVSIPLALSQKDEKPATHTDDAIYPTSAKNKIAERELREATVLIIDDNAEIRTLVKNTMPPHFQVLEASDGDEGIQLAMRAMPDFIISDLMMPGKNGYEVCSELKNDELTAHIPIILLTAKGALESKIEGLRTGADDYLTKPFHSEELLVRIENLLEQRRRLQAQYSKSLLTVLAPSYGIPQGDRDFLERLTQFIEENLDNPNLETEDISAGMLLSRSQFHRKLTSITGQSATEFLRNYRLDRALEMLRTKQGNVTEVAMQVGFNSQKYFSVRFKERFGASPSEV